MNNTTATTITTNETDKLTKAKVILVEGQDDKRFFERLLKHEGITQCQVMEYYGKDNLPNHLKLLATDPLFPDLHVLIVTRDADDDAKAAFDSIAYHIKAIGLQPPLTKNNYSEATPTNVGVFLLSGQDGNGMLEDLRLDTVASEREMQCVHDFSTCVTTLDGKPKKRSNIAKSKTMAFMAARSLLADRTEFVRHVGEAAEKGYWNFDSETLAGLREFLLRLQHN